jgi:hypothetical protein
MSHTIHFEGPRDSQAHSSKPLDETVWRAWLNKNLLEETQRAVARIKAVKWTCIGVLMATGVVSSYVFSPYVSAYQAVVRFAIGLGAIVIMFEAFVLDNMPSLLCSQRSFCSSTLLFQHSLVPPCAGLFPWWTHRRGCRRTSHS